MSDLDAIEAPVAGANRDVVILLHVDEKLRVLRAGSGLGMDLDDTRKALAAEADTRIAERSASAALAVVAPLLPCFYLVGVDALRSVAEMLNLGGLPGWRGPFLRHTFLVILVLAILSPTIGARLQ